MDRAKVKPRTICISSTCMLHYALLWSRTMRNNFFEEVYRVVNMIPAGRVATYGQIAEYLGNPRGARAVGWALRALPEGRDVPWHRVVNAAGRISSAGRGLGVQQQRAMLEDEGVVFDPQGRIDLCTFGWKGPQ
jgi:methylated-DNA-protein-cysteine methyltransferase-like protein